jgi:hypothetical protein
MIYESCFKLIKGTGHDTAFWLQRRADTVFMPKELTRLVTTVLGPFEEISIPVPSERGGCQDAI